MSSEFWLFWPSTCNWNLFLSNSYQNRLINSVVMNNWKKIPEIIPGLRCYRIHIKWAFFLTSLTEKRNSTTCWIKLLYHHKPRYSKIRMCSRKSLHTSSESLYTDLPTPLTLNKQRQGLGTGTINLSIDTLWIINQEVEIYISTMDYIFKSVIKLYTYIAGAVGVSCMSTQMHWIYNGECS